MKISDLNTLEVVDGSAVVGGSYGEGYGSTYYNYGFNASAKGHVAQSDSTAEAYGYGTATETKNSTTTTPNSSFSRGSAISVSSDYYSR